MKKKISEVKHGKRNFGIFFIILQCFGIYGATLDGNNLPKSFVGWIGFLIFGIIGIYLIILDIAENSDKKDEFIKKVKEYKYETNSDTGKYSNINFDKMDKQHKLEMYYQLNEIVEKAKKDLSTGVKKDELDYYYKKNYLSQDDYINTVNAIDNLEAIVQLYSPMVEELKRELDEK